jgi:hypothetical protein
MKMNKDQLTAIFGGYNMNMLVQEYKHGGPGQLHKNLEKENSFGKSNKTQEEALKYQQKCGDEGLNRFIVVHEDPKNFREPTAPETILRVNLMNIIYDYMKDYLGIQNDVSGEHIATGPDESRDDYVFKSLARNTGGLHRIVIHVSRDMDAQQCGEFYDYLSKTSIDYPKVKFLVLDQKDRGIEKMVNFEVMRWE